MMWALVLYGEGREVDANVRMGGWFVQAFLGFNILLRLETQVKVEG